MQQASTSRETEAPPGAPPVQPRGDFVINLCSASTPAALSFPRPPQFHRFTFFVSRRREEGRERFRLHMGYFESQEAAECLLELVRGIFPAAWAGLAPGQRLRRGAEAPEAPEAPEASLPEMPAVPVAAAPAPAPAPVAPASSAPARAKPAASAATPSGSPTPARTPDATIAPRAAASRPPARSTGADPQTAARALNGVRAAIQALDAPAGARAAGKAAAQREPAVLDGSQTLRLLETGQPGLAAHAAAQPRAGTDAPADASCYAVQLVWSVQPIDLSSIPTLAIFNAYTLYGAEGNRGGRRWYGLRLGFFTDAVSAKQVAQYVRPEFASVSVVPVTEREREHARLAASRPHAPAARPAPNAAAAGKSPSEEFRLIDDRQPVVSPAGLTPRAGAPTAAGGPRRGLRGAPGKRAKLRPGAKNIINGRARAKPMTLEQTLEILGADQLALDDARDSKINDSGVRHLQIEPVKRSKSSRIGQLIDRLSDRLGD